MKSQNYSNRNAGADSGMRKVKASAINLNGHMRLEENSRSFASLDDHLQY